MSDIRVDTKFFQHPKTLKLLRRLGPGGVVGLLRLWLWTAENRPTGYLHGLGADDVDLIAGGADQSIDLTGPTGPTGQTGPLPFCETAKGLGWIDEADDGTLVLHEWAVHNPWAADAPNRSDKARFSKLASVAPAAYIQMVQDGRNSITAEEYKAVVAQLGNATTKRQRNANDSITNHNGRSTPSPSPSPVPSPSQDIKDDPKTTPMEDVDKLIILYRRFPGYHREEASRERVWVSELVKRFSGPGLNVLEELKKALDWVRLQDFQVKNSRAYLLRWLERVQKERS